MAVIAIANAYVMWLIASMFFKPRVAIVCGSAFLLMPATLRYGLILLPANLGMLGVSVALLFMLRYLQSADAGRGRLLDLGLSALAFFLACITSWEPFLALPGLLLAYGFNRRSEILKTCFCWAIAAIAAGASTLVIYSLSDPTFLGDMWSIFTFRLGLTQYLPLSTRIHPVEGQLETIDSLNAFSSAVHFFDAYVVRTQVFCGSLGIVGIVCAAFHRAPPPSEHSQQLLCGASATALHRLAGLGGHHAGALHYTRISVDPRQPPTRHRRDLHLFAAGRHPPGGAGFLAAGKSRYADQTCLALRATLFGHFRGGHHCSW